MKAQTIVFEGTELDTKVIGQITTHEDGYLSVYYETEKELRGRLLAFKGLTLEFLDCAEDRTMEISLVSVDGGISDGSVIANISYDDIPRDRIRAIVDETHPGTVFEPGC